MDHMSRVGRLFTAAVLLTGASYGSPAAVQLQPVVSTAQAGTAERATQRRPYLPPEPAAIALVGMVLVCGAAIARRRMA
jgi:hypothetical protein